MQRYEYKVVPAPVRGEKAKGIKSTDARFAHALTRLFNALAADGWEYQRAESLPCEERTGLTRSLTVTQQHLLIFRRDLETEDAPFAEADEPPPPEALHEGPGPVSAAAPGPASVSMPHAGPTPVPPLRPVSAPGATPYSGFRGATGLRAPHDGDAPPRIVPLGAPGEGRDPDREG